MLIKLADNLRPTNALKKPYIGRVLKTDELEVNSEGKKVRLCRIKCSVDGLLEDVSNVDNLPWIYPWVKSAMGGANTVGSFSVPLVGTYVTIEFPYDDIYSGFYTGTFIDPNTIAGMYMEDYPDSYGHRDEKNNYWKINKAKNTAEFHHSSGSTVEFDADGEIRMTSKKGMRFISEDGHTELFFDMAGGSISLAPKEGFNLGGALTSVTSNKFNIKVGEINETVTGAKIMQIIGAHKKSIGGSYSTSVVGSVARSNTGDNSNTVGGKTDITYGQGVKQTTVLGDNDEKIIAGDKTLKMILGDYLINLILGKFKVDIKAGDVILNTLLGNAELKNALGSVKIDPTGAVTIDAKTMLTLNALVNATFAGTAQTTVGSGAGITNVLGSLVLLGGGGLPVARVGDQSIGVGYMGIPVVSNIISGSFKVLAG